MEYLQYEKTGYSWFFLCYCFKPYYKWNTFNTDVIECVFCEDNVLNLIINGIPSIP